MTPDALDDPEFDRLLHYYRQHPCPAEGAEPCATLGVIKYFIRKRVLQIHGIAEDSTKAPCDVTTP